MGEARAGARSQGRRAAVEALYESDIRSVPASMILDGWEAAGRRIRTFTRELVSGAEESKDRLDGFIVARTEGWALDRLAAIDRAILRVAVYELLERGDVPVAVAISEAVTAAKELSTADSGAFVNGVLGSIAREDLPPERASAASAAGLGDTDGLPSEP